MKLDKLLNKLIKLIKKINQPKIDLSLIILAIALAWSLQLIMTTASLKQIRFEELSESVRNVYFLKHAELYDGISSNVGWYGILLIIYQLFGFHLHVAKIFKLILFLLALISLAIILKKFLKIKAAWVLILIYGLSPTLLFFNTLQTSFGLDLIFFPLVVLGLCFWLKARKQSAQIIYLALAVFLTMLASMAYGVFLAYWPVLILFVGQQLIIQRINNKQKFHQLLAAVIAFLLPLLLVLLYLEHPSQLIYDSVVKSGIFRGGGMGDQAITLKNLYFNLKENWKILANDVYLTGQSYYFEPLRVELAHPFFQPLTYLFIFITGWVFFYYSSSRKLITIACLLLATGIIIGGLSNWFPGIRRMTPVLMAVFMIMIAIWRVLPVLFQQKIIDQMIGGLFLMMILFLISYHLRIFPLNLQALPAKSQHQASECFHLADKTPALSIQYFVEQAQTQAIIKVPADCRLHELYPAIAGSCEWNHLACQSISFDRQTKFRKPGD